MINHKKSSQNLSNEEIQKIIQKNEMLENIISVLPGHVYWKDTDCIMQGSNDTQAIDVGLRSRYEIVGKREYDIVNPNLPEDEKIRQSKMIESVDREVMKTGNKKVVEEVFEYPDGSTATFLSEKIPLKDVKSNIIGLVGISLDVSELKRLQQELLEAEKAKQQLQKERMKSMKAVAASIAHELRTPLTTINMGAQSVEKYMPRLLAAYKVAKESGLQVEGIRPAQYQVLKEVLESIQKEAQMANTIINMLLMNLRETGIDKSTFELLSMKECVEDVMNRYPFDSADKKSLIHLDIKNDFYFYGDKIYFTHVLFNLIKNAFYYIEKARKGEIKITISTNKKENRLSFIDTGTGVPQDILPKIFDNFFTSKGTDGTGVGLSFCKSVMQALGGDISCRSKEGEYTEFQLTFPNVEVKC